jgi:hypothetical protein
MIYNRDEVLQSMLEEDLQDIDLLSINKNSEWLYLLINGSIVPTKKELLELLEEIARLKNDNIHRLKLKYNYWLLG